MAEKLKGSYLTSLALAVRDVDNCYRHVQIVIFQEEDTKLLKCFFDVIDDKKIKLAEDELSESDNA